MNSVLGVLNKSSILGLQSQITRTDSYPASNYVSIILLICLRYITDHETIPVQSTGSIQRRILIALGSVGVGADHPGILWAGFWSHFYRQIF